MSTTSAGETIAHPVRAELELSAVLHALADPVRLSIVGMLARVEGEHTCGSFALPVTKSTCTHHFRVLREAGLIFQRQQGTTRLNTLRREDLEARFPGLLDTVLACSAAVAPAQVVARADQGPGAAPGPVSSGPARNAVAAGPGRE